MFASPYDRRSASVGPVIPKKSLAFVARELDREANAALNAGRAQFAEHASRRAEQLREIARAAR